MAKKTEDRSKELDREIRSEIKRELAALKADMKLTAAMDKEAEEEAKILLKEAGISLKKIREFDRAATRKMREAIGPRPKKPPEPLKGVTFLKNRRAAIVRLEERKFKSGGYPRFIRELTPPPRGAGRQPAANLPSVDLDEAYMSVNAEVEGTGWYGRRRKRVYGWFNWRYKTPQGMLAAYGISEEPGFQPDRYLEIYPHWWIYLNYEYCARDKWWSSTYVNVKVEVTTTVYQPVGDFTAVRLDETKQVLSRGGGGGYHSYRGAGPLDTEFYQNVHAPLYRPNDYTHITTKFMLELYAKSKYAWAWARSGGFSVPSISVCVHG